ncbi:peptidoglycan hydrolase PcsB [Streptococcus sp. A22]|uniref:peptidoglycan hydrolase PcsB n=1 Tax=Streptococcus sp. A22 TaxID=3373126 RepID=UPI00374DE2A5
MKKQVIATLFLSTIVLSQVGNVATISANDTDSKIAAQDEKINSIAAQQASAQAEVEALQGKVNAIYAEQDALNAENERLEEESAQLSAEIERLSADIVSRDGVLKEQARSAQVNGSATSYINTVLDSKSLVDAVSRVNAMREIVSANKRMLEQQKLDKEAIEEKQIANQEAINVVYANKQKLEDTAVELKTQEASLKAAQLNLAAEKATAENEKASLLAQKAAAEEAARKAAEEQAAYQARQAELAAKQRQAVAPVISNTVAAATPAVETPAQAQAATSAPAPAVAAATPAAEATTVATPVVTYSAGNTYPVGECTWGVKQIAPWVGNYWGNGGQWLGSAAAAGFRTGSTPQVGAVAVWTNSYYGHVAVVTAVNGSEIQVMESNFNGNRYVSNFRGWFNASSSGIAGYIYPN